MTLDSEMGLSFLSPELRVGVSSVFVECWGSDGTHFQGIMLRAGCPSLFLGYLDPSPFLDGPGPGRARSTFIPRVLGLHKGLPLFILECWVITVLLT